jgi:DNA-binding NarL/FixJ family response regulator
MPTETGAETIRVLLVDDHQVVRQGLAQLLGDGVGISVVGQAGTGEAALALAQSTPADVMVLDYSLPDVNGAKVASQLRRDGSTLRVVILTVHDNVHYVLRAMDAGADAFVVKSDSVEELLRAIRRVARDEGLPSIVVEQHPHMVLQVTDDAIVLDRGGIAYRSSNAALRHDPSPLDAWLGVSSV